MEILHNPLNGIPRTSQTISQSYCTFPSQIWPHLPASQPTLRRLRCIRVSNCACQIVAAAAGMQNPHTSIVCFVCMHRSERGLLAFRPSKSFVFLFDHCRWPAPPQHAHNHSSKVKPKSQHRGQTHRATFILTFPCANVATAIAAVGPKFATRIHNTPPQTMLGWNF